MDTTYKKAKITLIDIENAINGYVPRYHNRKLTGVKEGDIAPYMVISGTFI